MCGPAGVVIPLVGMAVAAAGSAINASEQKKDLKRQQEARTAAANTELDRQKAFQQEAQPVFQGAFTANTPQANQQALNVARQERAAKVQGAQPMAEAYTPAPASATGANAEVVKRMAEASGKSRATAGRRADLGAWGDVGFTNRQAIGRAGDQLGTLSNLAGGSFRLLPYEQEAAARNATKGTSGFGDLLQLGGSAMSMYGMMGGQFPGMGGAAAIPPPTYGPYGKAGLRPY